MHANVNVCSEVKGEEEGEGEERVWAAGGVMAGVVDVRGEVAILAGIAEAEYYDQIL